MPSPVSRLGAPMRAISAAVPLVDPVPLAELRRALNEIEREVRLVKRELAWSRVLDDAVRVCRLLRKVEQQESMKDWRDQPRVAAGTADGGQWTDGGDTAGSGTTADAPSNGEVLSDVNPDDN